MVNGVVFWDINYSKQEFPDPFSEFATIQYLKYLN